MARFPAILSILAGLITWNYMYCVPDHGSGDLQEGDSHMVPDTFSSVAKTQTPHPLAGVSRWAKRSAKLLGAAAVGGLLASPVAFANGTANSERMTREERAERVRALRAPPIGALSARRTPDVVPWKEQEVAER